MIDKEKTAFIEKFMAEFPTYAALLGDNMPIVLEIAYNQGAIDAFKACTTLTRDVTKVLKNATPLEQPV